MTNSLSFSRMLAWTAPVTLALTALAPALPAKAAAKPTAPTVTAGRVDRDLNGDGVPDLVAVGTLEPPTSTPMAPRTCGPS